MSAVFFFEIKVFEIFKGLFLSNAWTYRYDFRCVFGDLCETSNKYNFAIFFKI